MTDSIVSNPFSYGYTVLGKHFVNRDAERNELITDIQNHTNLILYSPRRYGKTSLLLQVLEDIKQSRSDFLGLYIDFFKIYSVERFLQVLSREYSKKIGWNMEKVITFFRSVIQGVQPTVSMDDHGNPRLDISFSRPTSPDIFDDIMELPNKLAKQGKLVCVVYDEFQEIDKLNGIQFQKELRSVIQHHSEVSYIFCGSKQNLIAKIFSSSNSPLFNIGKMKYLDKISPHDFIPFIIEKMIAISPHFDESLALEIYDRSKGIPYYVQMLAYEYYNLAMMNPNIPPSLLLDKAVEKLITEKNEEYIFINERLSPSQRKTLEIVILQEGRNLFGKETLSTHAMAASTLKKALTTLVDLGILQSENRVYRFQDVFFEHWIKLFV